MTGEMTRKLSALASRDPFYCGWHFARYAEMTGMSMADLAGELGCIPETISAISLCRSPRAEPPHFREDVEAVADRFHIRADRLANVVRHVKAASEDDARLFAARDRGASDGPDSAPDG